jgi:hypothetical protein
LRLQKLAFSHVLGVWMSANINTRNRQENKASELRRALVSPLISRTIPTDPPSANRAAMNPMRRFQLETDMRRESLAFFRKLDHGMLSQCRNKWIIYLCNILKCKPQFSSRPCWCLLWLALQWMEWYDERPFDRPWCRFPDTKAPSKASNWKVSIFNNPSTCQCAKLVCTSSNLVIWKTRNIVCLCSYLIILF